MKSTETITETTYQAKFRAEGQEKVRESLEYSDRASAERWLASWFTKSPNGLGAIHKTTLEVEVFEA